MQSTTIAVLGATGQIGTQVVSLLSTSGHTVTSASRESGVDAAVGTGIDEALAGADVLVDVLNSPSLEDDVALTFFTATSANLTHAAQKAGVKHYVLLSIVGVDQLPSRGYLRGKVVQENTVAASGVPYTIVRATQFHELTEQITDSLTVDGRVHAPDALIQPIASADVAAVIARVATEPPANGTLDIAGPEPMSFAAMAEAVLATRGKDMPVVVDPSATYFGTPLQERSLVPDGDAELSATSLTGWLGTR